MSHTVTKKNGKIFVTNNKIKTEIDKNKNKKWNSLSIEEKLDLLASLLGIIDDQGNVVTGKK